MKSLHVLISRHHKTIVFRHLNHTSAASISPYNYSQNDYAKEIAEQVSSSPNINHLNQIFTTILKTHFLYFNPVPFHYNNIARAFTRLHAPKKALFLYIKMIRDGVATDTYTLPIVLKAACHFFEKRLCGQLHCVAVKYGVEKNMYCESGFICFYFRCGEIENAYKVFDENPERKLGSWNAMMAGLAQGGRGKEAIGCFGQEERSLCCG
ncbi:hypothetical protein Leryth_023730 [Lithospermum erythrorhizon]|nr:hypothetical protein Leryth_023730 [Lithospermum erythrorhizon]